MTTKRPPKLPPGRRQWRKNFIREWREFRGLTQEQLAERIARTKATVSRIETGDIAYTREFLEVAADVLGTHPGILLIRAPVDGDRYLAETHRPKE
jgi:transcriptional regulator with XRE-family HTH domain